MKVQITQTVEINQAAWALEFGLELSDVRDDVKAYFSDGQMRAEGLGLALETRLVDIPLYNA